MKVKDVMKKHVVTVDPDMNMSTISKILTNNRIGSVVIVNEGMPIGMITTNDIVTVIAKGQDPKKIKALKFWEKKKRPFITVSPDEKLFRVAKKMLKSGIKRFPVVVDGELKGIVSTKEIILVAPELIEILSEKLKAGIERVARPEQTISGLCEKCGEYSDDLRNTEGRWLCQDCRDT
ncbi:MAG: CBS domain-containing protein [Candidatus Aenigmatarchaeota archaeon]|nr:MAG: CBS domain-containing protein [Candidatus Aenigmarchaeota archaeon]